MSDETAPPPTENATPAAEPPPPPVGSAPPPAYGAPPPAYAGQHAPVSALTGLWVLLPLIGGIVWFVKTNGAPNDYWRSVGAS